ncbi:hypothetical protein P7K49_021815, partial [Saguinus oedipus]
LRKSAAFYGQGPFGTLRVDTKNTTAAKKKREKTVALGKAQGLWAQRVKVKGAGKETRPRGGR